MPPIYEYKCSRCEKEVDKLVSFKNADEQFCDCEDNAQLERQEKVHATGFALKGNWFKQGY